MLEVMSTFNIVLWLYVDKFTVQIFLGGNKTNTSEACFFFFKHEPWEAFLRSYIKGAFNMWAILTLG